MLRESEGRESERQTDSQTARETAGEEASIGSLYQKGHNNFHV